MYKSFQKVAFTAGVLAPRLHGRSDLEQYDFGFANSDNWFVDFLGPAVTRAGLEFIDYIQHEDEPVRITSFRFNANIGNNYLLIWTKNRLRFAQNGAYILETAVSIDSISGTAFTATAHGLAAGDMLKIDGQTVLVATTADPDTFTVSDPFGVVLNLETAAPTEFARAYTVASPYATEHLRELSFDQHLNELYITHRNYRERKLVYSAATSWAFTLVPGGGYAEAVSSLTLTPSAAGSAGVVFAVTAVDAAGVEAPLSAGSLAINAATVNWTTTAGYMLVRWAPTTGAVRYRVYRSLVYNRAASANFGVELGYVGETFGTEFTDTNITPDFTRSPLTRTSLMMPGGIEQIDITAVGSGYTSVPSVGVSGGGSGFSGVAILNNGTVGGVLILNAGSGYASPTVSITGGGGSGATATAVAVSTTDTFSETTAIIQQRRYYAGATASPGAVFGSRILDYDNFNTSRLALDNDPISLLLAQSDATNIRHLVEGNAGMFIFGESRVRILRGTDDQVILPSASRSDLQEEEGCGFLQPLSIGRDLLFATPTSKNVYALRPSNLPNYYQTVNLSFVSNHLFSEVNQLRAWAWANEPHRLIWAVRDDGSAISGTYLAEQGVVAWASHSTAGFFEDTTNLRENGVDRAYFAVRRQFSGGVAVVLERMALRETISVEDMWAVDCGLRTELPRPAASLTLAAFSGSTTATASGSVFVSGDVGKIIRAGNGKAVITDYTSGTEVAVDFLLPISVGPNQSSPPTYPQGAWSLAPNFTTFAGLSHLEGREVEILADGKHVPNQTVTGGQITLDEEASYVVAGLPYSAELETLPITASDQVIDGNLKKVVGVAVRMHETRGLAVGEEPDYYEVAFEPGVLFDSPPQLLTGLRRISIRTARTNEGKIRVRKVGPQHAAITGLIMETDIERQS